MAKKVPSELIETINWIDINDNLPDAGMEVLLCFERNDCHDVDVTLAEYDDSLVDQGEPAWCVDGSVAHMGRPLYWAEKPWGPSKARGEEPDQTVHVIAVLDMVSNHEALYVGGDLEACDSTIYMSDLAKVSADKLLQFSHVMVELPEDFEWPEHFEEIMKYVVSESELQS